MPARRGTAARGIGRRAAVRGAALGHDAPPDRLPVPAVSSTDHNKPTPALVTQREVARLPRFALWLFCAAYLLPGLIGRDPWKNADISAFGAMLAIAEGRTSWWAPTIAGLPAEPALLPYWLGALSINLLGPLVGAPMAARVPFALLLGGVLLLTWYSTYHLARTDAAQPLPLAFGGEAGMTDYARAVADGALLGLIATLGLLQFGHETTPELVQLAGAALFLYGLAAIPFNARLPQLALLAALPVLAASGAPSIGFGLGAAGILLLFRSSYPSARGCVPWLALSLALAAGIATASGAWTWRIAASVTLPQVGSIVRLLVWFCWPAWVLAVWTLWRWRRHLSNRHIAVPLGCAAVPLAASLAMGGSDRALMLALPALAVLAAFALPTLQRATSSAIDWFSVFFFSACALVVWIFYLAMQTGVPAQPAATVQRLAPGFVPSFSLPALALAVTGTLAWIGLVRWRTGRTRHPLWKSLVLPASGVALFWLLLMTLGLPLLDYARSYRPLIERIARHVPRGACVAAPGLPRGQLAALEYFGHWRVDATRGAAPAATACPFLLLHETSGQRRAAPAGWTRVASERQPADRDNSTAVFRRAAAAAAAADSASTR